MRHRSDEDRQRERAADAKAASHVAQFGVVFLRFGGDCFRFQRHAALGAIARMILLHLGMHRAGIERFCGWTPRGVALQGHAAFWAIAGLFGFHAGAHRAKVSRGCGRFRLCVSGCVAMASAASVVPGGFLSGCP